jgi:hypothetical protein
MISVHKFEERIVPKFFWFDLRLAASLYNIYVFQSQFEILEFSPTIHAL